MLVGMVSSTCCTVVANDFSEFDARSQIGGIAILMK